MSHTTEPVAIVGIALRYPGSCGPSEFFDTCRFSHSRLRHADPLAAGPFYDRSHRSANDPFLISNDLYGSIRDISWIDAKRFRVPPLDIEGDPSPFLCLQVASEALTDYQSGRPSTCIPNARTGVVIGRGDHPHRGLWAGIQGGIGLEYIRSLLLQRSDLFSSDQVDFLVNELVQQIKPTASASRASTLVSNVISGLVANRLDLQGPNFLVDAACASAIVAIQQATHLLNSCETDLMLVGASQATMEIPILQMFSLLGAISDSDIQPFNPLIDGTLLSEGVGFVALKRLSDARRDGDRIYSIIRGCGLASDGNDTSVLAPSSRGQILAMHKTYSNIPDVHPNDIGYLEAHSTGINLGDQTELNSIREVFIPSQRERPLVIGTLKSLIGHSIPASGIASLIRASYAVSYGVYPNSRCDHLISELDSFSSGIFLPTTISPWYERPSRPRRAAINCFGFGGINGHLVLEQDIKESDNRLLFSSGVLPELPQSKELLPSSSSPPCSPRKRIGIGSPVYILCLSYNTFDDLKDILLTVPDRIPSHSETGFCLSLSSQATGSSVYRIGLVHSDLRSLQSDIHSLLNDPAFHIKLSKPVPSNLPKLAAMLPGEAVIPFGYLSELSRYMPSVKSLIEFVDAASTTDTLLADILHPAWHSLFSTDQLESLQALANHHDNATKSLFVTSVAYFGILRHLGVEPSAFIGHSTGEINALMLAGGLCCQTAAEVQSVLTAFDEINLDPSYLSSIASGVVALCAGLDELALSDLLKSDEDLYLVSDNSPSHRLIFSQFKSFDELAALVSTYGGFALPTQLDRSYHTPLFAHGSDLMKECYARLPLVPLKNIVYSCCSADQYPSSTEDQKMLLIEQWTKPVRFREALLNMYKDGIRCFLELNARSDLHGYAQSSLKHLDDVSIITTGTSKDNAAVLALSQSLIELWQLGFNVLWDRWDTLFCYSESLSLPEIVRPPNATTILHDLHLADVHELNRAWVNADPQEARSHQPLTSGLSQTASPDSVLPSSHSEVISEPNLASLVRSHQQTMSHALNSLRLNTLAVLRKLE